MRALALIQGVFVALAVLVFSGLSITWVFAGVGLFFFVVDCIVFYDIVCGRTETPMSRFIRWLTEKS